MSLKELVQGASISEVKLASELGVSRSTLRKWLIQNKFPVDRFWELVDRLELVDQDQFKELARCASSGRNGRPKTGPQGRWWCKPFDTFTGDKPPWCVMHMECLWTWKES